MQNPSHTYDAAGSFMATLTVTGGDGQTNSTSQTIVVTNPPPVPSSTVSVVASQPLASSLIPGAFTFTRTGSTSSSLTIYYTLGGTAVKGVDYQTLSGSVVIPAGASSVSLLVNPRRLDVLRTVVLTIAPNPAYNVGSPNAPTVLIVVST
jgi:PKD repeat protein